MSPAREDFNQLNIVDHQGIVRASSNNALLANGKYLPLEANPHDCRIAKIARTNSPSTT
jgi:hypothetical protein